MKKTFSIIALCLILSAVLAAGCLGSGDAEKDRQIPFKQIELPEDTALYRGKMVNISTDGNVTTVVLEQISGTDFGADSMTFVIDDDSMNFNFSSLEGGTGEIYLEIYYDLEDQVFDSVRAVAANLITNAGVRTYSGEIVDVHHGTTKNAAYPQSIKVKLDDGSVMVFHCDGALFYMDPSDVKAGTDVSIVGSSFIFMSLPAQAYVYEIRPLYPIGNVSN